MDLEKVVAHYGANAIEFHRVTNQVEARLVALTQRFAGAAAGGGFLGAMVGAGVGTVAVAAISAIEAPIRVAVQGMRDLVGMTSRAVDTAIQLSMEWEKSAIAFEVMTGSAAKGNKLLSDLQQLAIETPYRSSQLTHYGEVLMGYGTPFEDVVPALARLGDIAGGNADKFRRLTLAFGQVLTAGRFMGQEKRQFAEAGVGLADFAKTAGMSEKQFVEAMERGEVGTDIMVKTINRLTNEGGRFYGLTRRLNLETVAGQWDAFMERMERMGRFVFAGDATRGIKGLFQRFGVGDFFGDLSIKLEKFESTINPFLDRFESWAKRGLEGLSPLRETFDILADRAERWAKANEDMVPTWEKINQSIKEFNANLPSYLDSVEKSIARTKEWGREFSELGKSISGAWDQLNKFLTGHKEGDLPQGNNGPVTIGDAAGHMESAALDATKTANTLLRLAGAQGDEERKRQWDAIQKEKAELRPQVSGRLSDPVAALNAIDLNAPIIPEIKPSTAFAQLGALPPGATDQGFPSYYNLEDLPDAYLKERLSFHQRRMSQFALSGAATFIDPWDVEHLRGRSPDLAAQAAFGVYGQQAGLAARPPAAAGAFGAAAYYAGLEPPVKRGLLPAPEIGTKEVLSPNVNTQLHRALIKEINQRPEDLGAYGKFEKRVQMLDDLFKATSNIGVVTGMAAAARPQITGEQYERGVFEAYKDLEKQFARGTSAANLAPAAKAGTGEERDIVNKAMMEQTNATERMLTVMEGAKAAAQAQDNTMKQIIAPLLQQIAENSGVVIGRGN